MKNRVLLSVLVLVLGLQGCSGSEQENTSCDAAMGEHLISYMGRMEGTGKMHLRAIPAGKMGALQANLTLFRSASDRSPALIQLQGAGSCERGVVRVAFGPVAGQNEDFVVVGGSLLGVFRSEIDPVPFGRWDMDIQQLEGGEKSNTQAFWQVVDEPQEIQ
jgi:hypothetical protein